MAGLLRHDFCSAYKAQALLEYRSNMAPDVKPNLLVGIDGLKMSKEEKG